MIDFKQYIKYSKPGPRYTSYPTAPEFHENFTHKNYEEILKNQSKNKKLSIYVHLPFCRSACYFCGCNVIYTSKNEKKEKYISYLKKELQLLSQFLDTKREVLQFHFGGGTPTFYDHEQLEKIMILFKKHFINFSKDAEISCEIDPRFLTKEQLAVFKKYNFNRISFGVQDFDEKVQKEIHRIQPFELTKNAVNLAKSYGINSINLDLIYGLPYQNLGTFKKTLELSLKLNPDRFAIFNYAHLPWLKKSMRKFDETTIPSPDVKLEILQYTIGFMKKNGYKMIGMDHFAKPSDELFAAIEKGELHRNFQGYTTKGGTDLIGIGLTSIGEGYSHYVQNFKILEDYEKAIDNGNLPVFRGIQLNDDDILRKQIIMDLMSNFKLNIKKIENLFQINFFTHFKDAIKNLQEFKNENLIEITQDEIKVNQTGTLLIRNICMPFDNYLQKNHDNSQKFSKTV